MTRALAVAVATVLVIALVSTIGVVSAVRRSFPSRDGTAQVPGLAANVTVRRDDAGVPQIYADSPDDLFMAQGYVQAQDRFFEMDLRRHITAGRLSELVGSSSKALEADKVIRTLGWRRVAEKELPLLSASTRQYLQAYADGVNAYLADRSPSQLGVEYTLLDVKLPSYHVERWTPVDSLSWLKAMAWDLRSNYDDELTRARLAASLPVHRIEQLYPPYPFDEHAPIVAAKASTTANASAVPSRTPPAGTLTASDTPAGKTALRQAQEALDAVPALLGRGNGIGSNSWVVSGTHTTTGKPLLADDPHLAASLPSVWYQTGLHCRTLSSTCPFEVSGFTFAGMPGVIIGHNSKIAWGFTNLAPDVTDFYLERIFGNRADFDGRYTPLTVRHETIKVRGGADVDLVVRSSRHGPLLSDVLPQVREAGHDTRPSTTDSTAYDVALAWTALTPGRCADALFALDRAKGWWDFRAAAMQFDVPAQNLIYADVEGNIGYQAPGRVPVRHGYDGRWPVPGWSSDYGWSSYVPFDKLPHVLNPPEGFIVAANQAVSADAKPFLTKDWGYGYRSQRIRELLQTDQQISPAKMSQMQLDTRNGLAPVLVPLLLATDLSDEPFTREGQQLLKDWDYTQPPDSAAAAYYNAVWSNLLRLGFDDELGQSMAADGGERWFEVVRGLIKRKTDPWWDNRATPGVVENRDEMIRQAMVAARVELTRKLGKDVARWQWGKLHRMELENPVLGGSESMGLVRALVNAGPYDLGGGSGSIDATGWSADAGYGVNWAPSMRMVVNLGDLDRSTWVNLAGVSGHPFDAHSTDQTDRWVKGETYPWPFTQRAVDDAGGDELTLEPGS